MGKVHLLDSRLSNMIAAGEVVERPSGVVKEAVENAIDALSSRIEVHLMQGGIKEISIIDNGIGMDKEDACMAFTRHATSKIVSENDLFSIQTLGFRGEALPSIASVSDVTLRSSNGESGTEVKIANGEVISVSTCSAKKGTQLIVRDLFFTLPARLKHLKSVQYEFSLVLEMLQKLALSNPTIAFLLTHDGKEVFRTNGNGDLLNIIYEIYGSDVAKSCIKLDISDDDFSVNGYICLPNISRANRNHMTIFINARLIKAYRIQQAIIDGYEKFIAEKRLPVVFLNIKMDTTLVDVNVHPSKWEVRLSKEYQLYALITMGISEALSNSLHKQASIIGSIGLNKRLDAQSEQLSFNEEIIVKTKLDDDGVKKTIGSAFYFPDERISEKNKPATKDLLNEYVNNQKVFDEKNYITARSTEFINKAANNKVLNNNALDNNTKFGDDKELSMMYNQANLKKSDDDLLAMEVKNTGGENNSESNNLTKDRDDHRIIDKMASAFTYAEAENSREENAKLKRIPSIDILGQLHGSYIIGSTAEGLLIIDQHAANERINYEKLLKQFDVEHFDSQVLLLPLVINLNNMKAMNFEKIKDNLAMIGINIESFGERDIILREMPLWLKVDDEKLFIIDLIEKINNDQNIDILKIKKHTIATLACHSSVRFNHALSMAEMHETLALLFECENPYHCPHGRPTMITYSATDLRKLFDRT